MKNTQRVMHIFYTPTPPPQRKTQITTGVQHNQWNSQTYTYISSKASVASTRVFDRFDVCILKKLIEECGWNYIKIWRFLVEKWLSYISLKEFRNLSFKIPTFY